MAASLLDRGNSIVRWGRVAFYPRSMGVEGVGEQRELRGEFWLVGAPTGAIAMRHRTGADEWQASECQLDSQVAPTETSRGRNVYSFRVPLAAGYRGDVQLEVTQNDRNATRRTFTYAVE